MSVEAISWAFNLAPVPRDRNGNRNPACKAVLIGLANHAGPDGKDAFPSVRTLVRYTDLSERTVRTALDRLEAEGTIRPCDPAVVAAKIKRADQRPQGWDLSMHLIRDDLDDDDLAVLENQFPGLTARVRAARKAGSDQPGSGVQQLHPAPETAVDNDAGEVHPPSTNRLTTGNILATRHVYRRRKRDSAGQVSRHRPVTRRYLRESSSACPRLHTAAGRPVPPSDRDCFRRGRD